MGLLKHLPKLKLSKDLQNPLYSYTNPGTYTVIPKDRSEDYPTIPGTSVERGKPNKPVPLGHLFDDGSFTYTENDHQEIERHHRILPSLAES